MVWSLRRGAMGVLEAYKRGRAYSYVDRKKVLNKTSRMYVDHPWLFLVDAKNSFRVRIATDETKEGKSRPLAVKGMPR
jgi:hypothetical protein